MKNGRWKWYDPLLRVWQWYVNRQRERLDWPRLGTGQLPDLRDGSGITKKLQPLASVSRETGWVRLPPIEKKEAIK